MSTKTVIKAILKQLYKDRDNLAGNKFSGVRYVNDVYRIHMDKFIPGFMLYTRKDIYDMIGQIVDETFGEKAEWDSHSLWLTFLD